jgi:TetR/AcrR family transcriptional regulator, fatty acid metabolism regulator protein
MNERSFIMPATALRKASSLRASGPSPDKREAILRAATQVFARHGYFQSQVADVARAAGVAAGTVYLYFRSKEDLLVSLFERTMRDAIATGRAALVEITDPRERLLRIARLHLERLGRDRDLAVVFQVELRQSTKFMQRFSSTYLRDYLGLIRETIAEGQRARVFRPGINPTIAAKVFFGALDEMATNWMLSRRKYSLAAEADVVVDLFVGGIGDAVHRPPSTVHRQSAVSVPKNLRNGRTKTAGGRERTDDGRPSDSLRSLRASGQRKADDGRRTTDRA